MPKPLTWPEIKLQYPELAARLIAGDMSARVEFVRLAFGAEIVSEHHNTPTPPSPPSPPSRAAQASPRAQNSTARPGSNDPVLDIIPADQPLNPPF